MKRTWFAVSLVLISVMGFASEIKFQYKVPGHVFTARQNIKFSMTGEAKGICRIYTYDRTKVYEKELVVPGQVSIPELPHGYYFVEFMSSDKKTIAKSDFAVVPEPSERKVSYDAPYCMDLLYGGLANIDEFVELARLMGLKFARERYHHARTEPAPGEYKWAVFGDAQLKLSAAGIHLSTVWHDFAPWAKVKRNSTLVKDIFLPYQYAKTIGSKYKDQTQVWECWNEPELFGFNTEGVWEYASMMKAGYLGFKAGAPDHPVTNGAYCESPQVNNFARMAFQNDLADYADIFNFHCYFSLPQYSEIVQGWKEILKDNGIENQMLWITETGTTAEGLAEIKPKKGKFWHLSPKQEMIWAEFIPKSQILFQNLGISRTFFFMLRAYNERSGKKEWGLLRRDNSAKPGYAAFSTLLNELGNAKCLGEVDLGNDMRGFLYQHPDGSRTLAFWSLSELDTEKNGGKKISFKDLNKHSFIISGKTATVIDIFGTPHKISGKDGKVSIPSVRLTSYLRNAPAMEIKKAAEKVGVIGPRKREMDRSIVLRILPSKDFILKESRLSMYIDKNAKDKSIVLQVANFSDKTKKAVITVQGCKLPGFPAHVTLKPFSVTEIKTSAQDVPVEKHTVIFKGTSNGLPISQLVFPFQLLDTVKLNSTKPISGSNDPKNWKASSSGKMDITFDEPQQSLRFDVDFPKGQNDKWAYPIFKCPNGLNGYAFSFDIKLDLEGKGADKYILMLNDGVNVRFIRYRPKNHQWTTIFVDLHDHGLDPPKIKDFKIGMNPNKQTHITWYIRNIRMF